MVGARANILDGPIFEAIAQQVSTRSRHAIEHVPDFAFDLCQDAGRISLQDDTRRYRAAGGPANGTHPSSCGRRRLIWRSCPPGQPRPSEGSRDSIKKTLGAAHDNAGLVRASQQTTDSPPTGATASPPGSAFGKQRSPRRRRTPSCRSSTASIVTRSCRRPAPASTTKITTISTKHSTSKTRRFELGNLGFCPAECCSMGTGRHTRAALYEHLAERVGPESAGDQAAPGDSSGRRPDEDILTHRSSLSRMSPPSISGRSALRPSVASRSTTPASVATRPRSR